MDESLIRNVPLFSTLSQEQITHLAATLPINVYTAPTVLFYEGEVGDCVYIVLKGQIAVVKALATEDERLVGVRSAGALVGEIEPAT